MSLSAIEKESFSKVQLAGLILIAYLFSLMVRMIWVYQMGGIDEYHWNGQLMINTNDGYFFASGAQKALYGMHEFNPRVPELFKTATITLTAFATKYLGLSLDTVILYMPALVSSLVVIPIVLIGRLYSATLLGFCAALIGSITWSYYNRTMVGYFDTDMFSAMAPMFILYFLLGTAKTEKLHFALLGALSVLIYPYLYDQGRAVVYAMGLMYMVYMLLFYRKEEFTYSSILLISLGLMGWMHWGIKLALVAVAYGVIRQQLLNPAYIRYLSLAAALSFLATSNMFMIILGKVSGYLFRGVEASGLKFFQVSQTVREAGRIPFEMMANRISGSIPGVLASLVGYVLLLYKRKEFILALPLIGIGVFSLVGGLRFTVYAVPVAAIGAVYLFYVVTRSIGNKYARGGVVAAMTAAMLYPNLTHIIGYKVPTVFNKQEVETLGQLKQVGTDKDYVVTWWDYGYPIWYYAGKNTLIDGGKHSHDNFIVSEVLTTDSQQEAARLSRLAVETYVNSNYATVADTLFRNEQPDQIDPNAFLETLKYGDVELPDATRNVYLYLPYRMMDIFPTVSIFSNLDLTNGQQYSRPFFYATVRFQDSAGQINLGRGIVVDKQKGMVRLGRQEVPLRAIYRVNVQRDGSVRSDHQPLHMDGALSLIYMGSYGKFLLVDEKMLRSTYIQMFVFGKYDATLFEPVISNPWAKVFRLKI